MGYICQCGCKEEIPFSTNHKWRPPTYKRGHVNRTSTYGLQMTEAAKRRNNELPILNCQCGCGERIPPKASHRKYQPKYIQAHYLKMGTHLRITKLQEAKIRERLQPPPEWAIPTGLCNCGCGQATKVAKVSRPAFEEYAGYHIRYVHGHHAKGQPPREGRWRTKDGYIMLYIPDYPSASKGGYIPEHRYIYEKTHNVVLPRSVHVHHINGIRDDNDPANLMAATRSEHKKAHQTAQYLISLAYDKRLYAAFCEYVLEHGTLPNFATL